MASKLPYNLTTESEDFKWQVEDNRIQSDNWAVFTTQKSLNAQMTNDNWKDMIIELFANQREFYDVSQSMAIS